MSSTEERDAEICRAYTEENKTAERLALQYGLGVSSIWKILKRGSVKKDPTKPKVRRSPEEKQLGEAHVRIGLRLSHYRSFSLVADRIALAKKLGWSLQKVAAVEKGQFNLSLVDLQDLATLFKVDLSKLFEIFSDDTPPKETGKLILVHDSSDPKNREANS